MSVVERRQREVKERESGGAVQAEGLERHGGVNLTIYYTARDDNLSSYFYYGNHSKGLR